MTSGPHNVTLTANPAQSDQDDTGEFTNIGRIVVLSTSNGPTTKGNSGNTTKPSTTDALQKVQNSNGPTTKGDGGNTTKPSTTDALQKFQNSNVPTTKGDGGNTTKPSTIDAFQKVQNAAQGSNRPHHLHRLNAAVIGGTIAGTLVLLLLILLAIVLYRRRGRRRHDQRGRSRLKISIWRPKTPNLPMHVPPPWGMSPRTPFPSDLEKGVGHPVPTGPQEGNPFTDDAQEKLTSVPDMS